MTYPTSYNESTMSVYLLVILDKVNEQVSLSGGRVIEMCDDILSLYGVTDWAEVTNIPKVRALAKVIAWKHAMEITSVSYNFSADGGNYSLSQMHDMCQKNYKAALSDAMLFDSNYVIAVEEMVPTQNPYAFDPDRIERGNL
jgi:hypothetical protein